MISHRRVLLLTLLLPSILAGCSRTKHVRGSVAVEGIENASIHLLVDNTQPTPESGVFDWGPSYMQIDPELDVDLADLDHRLHEAIEQELAQRGFVRKEEGADYLVGYAVAVGANIDEDALNKAYGDQLDFPASGNVSERRQYRQGAVIVDIVDARSKRLLWRGAILAEVDVTVGDEQRRKRTRAAIHELLGHFPEAQLGPCR